MAKPAAIYGPEPWRTDGDVVWSHWDLWLCLVAWLDHGGDVAALAAAIEAADRLHWRSDTEAKLSHLDDLAGRLAAADLETEALAAGAAEQPAVRAKARAKVLKQGLYPRDLTDAIAPRPASGSTSERCAAVGTASPPPRDRGTTGWSTASERAGCIRTRRSGSSGASKPRATGTIAVRGTTPPSGWRQGGRS